MSNNKKIRVAVLFGGRSGEHEVSLVSASSVIENLDKEKYEVIPVGITKEGRWIAGPESMKLLKANQAPKESNIVIPAEPNCVILEGAKRPIGSSMDSIASAADAASLQNDSKRIDVVFPVLHGPYGEDGTVQGFLELTGLPYVGCGVLASAVAMDKVMQKKVFQAEGLLQVPYVWFWRNEWSKNQDKYIGEIETMGYPVFVKPANLGSSVGINKAKNREELKTAIAEASAYDRKVLVEKGIENAREIECSVLGNQEVRASVPGQIIPSNEFYDYDAKYVDGKSDAKIPADLPADIIKIIQAMAISAFRALSGEGLARVDFFLTADNKLYINEVNTMPGFTSISMYPKLWEASGLGYSALLDELIKLALARSQEKNSLKISYEPKAAWYA
ncbi:MAG: D-alanine--D-alanine ligase [Candidatus Komeilibacteria bacterium]|nr:D-alanine--D-alanine ligase [Candidatus Komeilibacteria bacterium]